MMRSLFYLTILIGSLLTSTAAVAQDEYNIQGVMQHTEIEGGCWYLQDLRGNKFEIVGSEELLRVLHIDGRHVSIMVRPKVGHSSICMLGPILEVTEIFDTVAHPRDPVLFILKLSGTIKKMENGCYYLQTKQGKRYEIDQNAPAKFRKKGKKISGVFRIVDPTMSKCNTDGVLVGDASKEQVKRTFPTQ